MQHQAVETEEVQSQAEDPSPVPRCLLSQLACAVVPRLVLLGALLGVTGGISPSQLAHAVAGDSTSAGSGCHDASHQGRSCH